VVADCSMPWLQPQERRGRRELSDELTAPVASGCRLSEDTVDTGSLATGKASSL